MRKFNAPTFVSAEPPQNAYDPVLEKALTKGVERDFLVPALENLGGGVGVFLLVGVILFAGSDADWWRISTVAAVTVATYCGVGALALACIVRFLGDEMQEWSYRLSKGWSEGRNKKELKWYQEEIEHLRKELHLANTQTAQMSKFVTGDMEQAVQRVRPEQDEYTEPLKDAVYLCRFHEAHGTIAREKVMGTGQLTKSRWEAGRQLLIHSGVPINNGVFGVPVGEALGDLREFVEKQRRAPEGFVYPSE